MKRAPFVDPIVLIVDDDDDIRDALEDVVAREGYRTASVTNGRDALDYLRAHREPPCIVVLDLLMPVMDGRELIEQLERERIEVRLIVLTATGAPELPAGIPWLQKPVAREALLAEIAAACPSRVGRDHGASSWVPTHPSRTS